MTKVRTILCVCTGNLCRSPMAAGFLKRKLEAEGEADRYEVRSAGTWAAEGNPATSYTVQVMDEHGIDVSDHRSHGLTAEDVTGADLILVMTRGHQEAIEAEFSEARGKTYLLSELLDRRYDIKDPYTGSLTVYRYCAEEIGHIIEEGFHRLLELTEAGEHSSADVG